MPRRSAKKSKLNKKIKIKFQRTLTGVLLFIGALSSLGGLTAYKTVTRPFASAQGVSSFDIVNSDISSLLIITVDNLNSDPVKTTGLDLVIYDKAKNKVVTFVIPLNWETDIPGRFGSEEFSKVVSLGMLNEELPEDGANLVRKAIEKNMAINVDRYLLVEEDIADSLVGLLENGKSGGMLDTEVLTKLPFSIVTDLRLNEFYDMYTFVGGLPTDRFITHKESFKFFELNDYTDTILRDLTFDSKVALEKTSVAILNGTNISGIADFSERVVTNVGGYTVATANATGTYHESLLVVSSLDAAVVEEIQRFFGVKKVIFKEDYEGSEHVVARADVTLIVGFDIANTL
jgi:hypothetical protein